jgi:hypothetical protein
LSDDKRMMCALPAGHAINCGLPNLRLSILQLFRLTWHMMQDVSDIGSPMAEPARRVRSGWGLAVASALLHLSLLAVFLIPLPTLELEQPTEETVSVEIVPPAPEPEGTEEANAPPAAPPAPAAPAPVAEPPSDTAEEQAALPPPPATMIAAPPPPPSDALLRDDQSGQAAPKDDAKAAMEAAPIVTPQPDEAPPAAPDVAKMPGTPPAEQPPETAKEEAAPPPPEQTGEAQQKPEEPEPREPKPKEPEPAEQGTPLTPDVTPPEADLAAGPAAGEPAAALADAVQAVPVPLPRPVQPAPAPDPSTRPGGAMEKADTLLSAARLENPALRSALGQLSPNRRLTQICSFEVAEQVARARPETPPDFVVPYGPSGGFIRGGTLDADGGAFRSGGRWFDVSFRCTVDMKAMRVTAFSYRLGKEVPPQQWPRRRLPGA